MNPKTDRSKKTKKTKKAPNFPFNLRDIKPSHDVKGGGR